MKKGVIALEKEMMPKALDSIIKNRSIIMVIGAVMLTGVVLGMYSSYWEGKIARADYEKKYGKDSKA